MALILLLSGNVADVQALVSRLAGCMSTTAIKEYLSRVATLLHAAMRVKPISNRWDLGILQHRPATCVIHPLTTLRALCLSFPHRMHYNIHYVLHLMQNEAVCGNPGQNG